MKKYEFYSIIFISPDSAATYLVNPLTAGASSARDRFFWDRQPINRSTPTLIYKTLWLNGPKGPHNERCEWHNCQTLHQDKALVIQRLSTAV